MTRNSGYVTEIARLRTMAAESRLRVIESQLALGFTLCAVAETEIRYSCLDEAIKVINKVRHHAETIRFHVNEKNHLPATAIPRLRKELTQLNRRVEEIELSLR